MATRKTRFVFIGLFLLLSMYFFISCEPTLPQCIDADHDGYGSPASTGCAYPELDCNDSNNEIYPAAPELCDGVDNQCPEDVGYGEVDEGCAAKWDEAIWGTGLWNL